MPYIANSYFFTVFRGSMPPFPLRMVMPTASHLKVKMQMKISVTKVAKGCGFYRIVWVTPECLIWLLTFNTLRHWYSYSPHCSLYISYGTDKENLSKKYIFDGETDRRVSLEHKSYMTINNNRYFNRWKSLLEKLHWLCSH